jgi:hypothetical protein
MRKLVLAFGLILAATAGAAPPTRVGENAPPFTAVDLAGKPMALGELRGKIVVIHFATSW